MYSAPSRFSCLCEHRVEFENGAILQSGVAEGAIREMRIINNAPSNLGKEEIEDLRIMGKEKLLVSTG